MEEYALLNTDKHIYSFLDSTLSSFRLLREPDRAWGPRVALRYLKKKKKKLLFGTFIWITNKLVPVKGEFYTEQYVTIWGFIHNNCMWDPNWYCKIIKSDFYKECPHTAAPFSMCQTKIHIYPCCEWEVWVTCIMLWKSDME